MDDNGKRNNNGKTDPAPSATTLPRERVFSAVNNIALTTLDELRQMRDQCDALMRSLTERQNTLVRDIDEFAALAESALETKAIIAEALGHLAQQFQNSPLPETVHMPKTKELPGTPQRDAQ